VNREGGPDDRGKIEWLYHLLYSRPPKEEEIRIGLTTLAAASAGSAASDIVWQQYCQAVLCANEFIFVD
jgi:hypothetical protein